MLYHDRRDAGIQLAKHLESLKGACPLILGVPRGGVVVASEVARRLSAELDIIISRKIGAPGNPELAVAAVDPDGSILADTALSDVFRPPDEYLQTAAERQRSEISRRLNLYRGERPALTLDGRTVVVVDDGIATGLTMAASLRWARAQEPDKLVLAVPVAPPGSLARLKTYVDDAVCPVTPLNFVAVGQFYRVFEQTTDHEVIRILKSHNPGNIDTN